jgi:hypothetical protein
MVMTDKPYSLIDAIREEKALLEELESVHRSENSHLLAAAARDNARMLSRILDRYEQGYEYYMGVKDGKPQLRRRQTTRHLEREYPAVARARQNLNTVVDIVKDQ